VTNFERALTIEENGDALNEYAILLTKRAQRLLKQLRLEGLGDLADDVDDPGHAVGDDAVVDGEDDGDHVQASAPAEDSEAAAAEDDHERATLRAGDVEGEKNEAAAPAENESGQAGAGADEVVPAQEEEDGETARRRARRTELLARANRYFDAAEAKFLELNGTGAWYGAINLACLAALRGREEQSKHWLCACRERHPMDPELLDDGYVNISIITHRNHLIHCYADICCMHGVCPSLPEQRL
jgi:hypothetical protein